MSLWPISKKSEDTPVVIRVELIDPEVRPAYEEISSLFATCTDDRDAQIKPCEIAAAYNAFWAWRTDHIEKGFPQFASQSAREAACVHIAGCWHYDSARRAILKQKPDFDAERELKLADMRVPPTIAGWGNTITRFAIMGCRTLAFATTGEFGQFRYLNVQDDLQMLKLARDITRQALGQEAFREFYPFANQFLDDY